MSTIKLSVSVPEHRWNQARRMHPDLSPSHLVQLAIQELIANDTSVRAYRFQ